MEPQGVGVQGTRVQGLGFYIRDDIRSGSYKDYWITIVLHKGVFLESRRASRGFEPLLPWDGAIYEGFVSHRLPVASFN